MDGAGRFNVGVELREADDGPRLVGTIIQEGRAATGGRAEVWAPGAVVWPSEGVGILTEHYGAVEVRAVPVRESDGAVRVSAPATEAMRRAFEGGRRFLSVEFHSLRETRTAGGVREIQRALVDRAAMTDRPEYHQAMAEVRERRFYL